ncbi:hypothetical protein SLEP1_g5279 [Rubroshorea leprosula]|uniref:Uncharacterized protein n=1 Tax=Rubroshorea leprosula TaxID=152421 RepID=A0AAV5HRQ5_9ROSI|nr:hypothetical protein SLEP1_g5279 [Rubroshorea leprosula]
MPGRGLNSIGCASLTCWVHLESLLIVWLRVKKQAPMANDHKKFLYSKEKDFNLAERTDIEMQCTDEIKQPFINSSVAAIGVALY